MSFGFSAGDFLAAGQLVKDVITSLRSAGGAKSEYQELIRELDSLDLVLQHLDKLKDTGSNASRIDSIKFSALSCRHPLSEFLAKVKKYDKSLGVWGGSSVAKSTIEKLKFTFGQANEIKKLQTYLNVHVGTINLLLAEHGLDVMTLSAAATEAHHTSVHEQLRVTRTILETIKQSVPAQALLLQKVYSMVTDVHKLVSGELKISWDRFSSMISNVCVSTQQIYAVVIEIRDTLSTPDTRMTYFQAPLAIQDALGFKFPVPSEYDFDMLNTVIRHRFKSGPGHRDVWAGNFELCNMSNRSAILTEATRLLPGMSIRMAIIMPVEHTVSASCPMPYCESSEAQSFPGGGFTCVKCHVWFDKSYKKRIDLNALVEALDTQEGVTTNVGSTSITLHDKKREVDDVDIEGEGYDSLKNVVWAVEIKETSSDPEHDYPILDDALDFLDELKEVCVRVNKIEIYNGFLDVMGGFKEKHLDVLGVIRQSLPLWSNMPEIALKFNVFLPRHYAIMLDRDTGTWSYSDGDGVLYQAETDLGAPLKAPAGSYVPNNRLILKPKSRLR